MTDLHDMLKAHVEATARLEQLVTECARLNDAGKKREAAKVLAEAEVVRAQLEALEGKLKPGEH